MYTKVTIVCRVGKASCLKDLQMDRTGTSMACRHPNQQLKVTLQKDGHHYNSTTWLYLLQELFDSNEDIIEMFIVQ